jgi:hypothetical protein
VEKRLKNNTNAVSIDFAERASSNSREKEEPMKLIRTLAWSTAVAGVLFLGAFAHVRAQQPDRPARPDQSQDRAREPELATTTGELTRVDAQARSFSVKSETGAEMLFTYDEKTIVTGAQNNVAGLATSKGSEVTVSYRNDSAGKMAAKIEVHAKR